MKIYIIALISLVFSFVSNASFIYAQETTYIHQKDISYTPNTDAYSKAQCKLDVYFPANKKDFVTVLWFHGGGLTGGNKEIPSYLKNNDIAIVAVGYRLSPKAKVTDIIEDAADAVKWTFDNIEQLGGSKQKIIIGGYSAGAYLSLMLTLNQDYLRKRGLDANQLFGVVSFSAQTITHFTARKEMGMPELQPKIDELSPLYWVRKDIPRTLLLTGDRELEMMGRYEENAYLLRLLKLHGNNNIELYELDGYGHDMDYPAYPILLRAIKKWNK